MIFFFQLLNEITDKINLKNDIQEDLSFYEKEPECGPY